ncbi:MAG: hypothetical protein IKP61_05670 [Spirochaetales bacterium]|nr:hypothetical protein [Spirochaetales bacterium]
MGKKIVCIITILVLAVAGVFASFATRPSASVWFGAVFCHPTADYLKEYPGDPTVETPPIRTSQAFGFDLEMLNLAFVLDEESESAIQVGVGLSYLNVSKSLPFGSSILKPYRSLGFLVDIDWKINSRFDLGFRYRFLPCRFTKTQTRFLAMDFELVPAFRIISASAMDISVAMPVTVSWKADAVSLRTSLALSLAFDSRRMRH